MLPFDRAIIKVLIVDDERKACTNLRNLLLEYVDPTLDIVGLAHNSWEAEALVKKLSPDAVFLDIEMPNENAFQFLDRISPFNFEVVFVTAYDEYAVKAFKLNAVDYILKPISIDELNGAFQKLRHKLNYKKIISAGVTSYDMLGGQVNDRQMPQKITLRDNNTVDVVDFKNICFVEAKSSYSRIVFIKDNAIKERVMSNPLSEYEELLPEDMFYRIHRSYLINCGRIKKIMNDGSGNVILNNDITLPVSRRRNAALLDFLKDHHYYID